MKQLCQSILGLCVLVFGACGNQHDESEKRVVDPNAPAILAVRYAGQSPRSYEILVFEVDFQATSEITDEFIEVSTRRLNETPIKISMRPLMLRNQLNFWDFLGTVRFAVELNFEINTSQTPKQMLSLQFRICQSVNKCGNSEQRTLLIEKLD